MNKSKPLVMLIEDHADISGANQRILSKAGYRVVSVQTLAEARRSLNQSPPDIVILDIMLPDGDGLAFIPEIRACCGAPVLLLTSLAGRDDRLEGLRAGGDDYITKPYDVEELRERVASFLRRDAMLRSQDHSYTTGPLLLNRIARRAYLDGKDLGLRNKEFDLLLLLAQNRGWVMSTRQLYEAVWDMPFADSGNAVWSQLSRLKKKLDDIGGAVELHSERGEGYRLEITEALF